MKLLGISCYYHDAAACLVDDGVIVAAAQEERFTRKKHDSGFPFHAVRYCLAEGGVGAKDLDLVAFYDKPILKFHRILETYFSVTPHGLRSFMTAVPVWVQEKLWIVPRIQDALRQCGVSAPEKLHFPEHHESHAASAFYPSPFDEAAILTLDGVGEWATATVGFGEGHRLGIIRELHFPHSLGLLYSAFTYFCGFRVNSGEYKLMGLAPYGRPTYVDRIREHLLDVKDDGSFRMDLDYFGYLDGLVMTNDRFADLFDGPPRKAETAIGRREMDLARSIQDVTEEIVLKSARYARRETGKRFLCLAGGVALNCVANGKLLRSGIFDDIWIQPAAGDAGGALGAALAVWHNALGNARGADGGHRRRDAMRGAYLGPEFSPEQIREFLDAKGYPYQELSDAEWAPILARLIQEENVIGLLQGRMEFGPRALGNRSIIGDARSPKMQSIMNLKIKYRESFRPFAPSVLEERIGDYFELDRPSPYMLLVADVRSERRRGNGNEPPSPVSPGAPAISPGALPISPGAPPAASGSAKDLKEWVNEVRSDVPAITHVDYSARVQSVSRETNPRYHSLLKAFDELAGCGVIINTSFNVRGEPIVCTPEDAYRCFMRTEMDCLVLGPFLLRKKEQPGWQEKENWRDTFVLD